jgi:hypothetical protein
MSCLDTIPALESITVQSFKDQFFRGFNYLPVYSSETTYNSGDIVYYETNGLFYRCIVNGTIDVVPTDTDNWTLTQSVKANYVWDADITEAYREACTTFNPELLGDDDQIRLGYLYLAAHYLVLDLRANGASSLAALPVQSRSVGNVSETYAVPEWMSKDPILSYYATTSYGQKYLNLISSGLVGNVKAVCGYTHP